jgi:hypothetical protein
MGFTSPNRMGWRRGKGTPMRYLRKAKANAVAIKGKASIAKG